MERLDRIGAARLQPQIDAVPVGDDWLHEIKYDGYRTHARIDSGAVRLLTRTGLDWTHKYHPIAVALSELPVQQAYLKRLPVGGAIQLGSDMAPGEYVLQVVVTDMLADEKHRVATQSMDFQIVK